MPALIPWKVIGAAAVAIAAVVVLSACATVADDMDFIERTARANATPSPDYFPLVIKVDNPHAICVQLGSKTQHKDGQIMGCAEYKGIVNAKTCTIFVGRDAPPWVIAHEKAHCKYGNWHK